LFQRTLKGSIDGRRLSPKAALKFAFAFWTPARQLEFAKWCVEKHRHSAGYIERLFNVMRSAFNDAWVTKIRLDAVGNKVETALMSHAPKMGWKREAIATELKIPARRPRPVTLSIEQMAAVLDSLKTPHLFRIAIMSLCTWARPQAIIDFDPAAQVDWNGGVIDLAVGYLRRSAGPANRSPVPRGLATGLNQGR
jgi:hypothetical protein